MQEEPKTSDTFFEHFAQGDRPTAIGSRLARVTSLRLFRWLGLGPHARVLEIGPGRGLFAELCLEAGLRYVAVEPNATMAASLEQRGAEVIRERVPPLPRLEGRFDAVVMIHLVEHLNSMQEALALTTQVKAVLAPEGKVLVCSPDFLNWRKHFFNCDFSHNYVTTERRLHQLLLNGGFRHVRSRTLAGPLAGCPAVLVSGLAALLPFGLLNALLPDSRAAYKLYKMQLTCLRAVAVCGTLEGPL
ncbi:MAG: class I SAM-dependent methyltransferase [Phycisphaerae bacterium]|nr:class I SAM-dependent methyltransferase [Phycisphaerae bacterium]